MLGRAHKAVDGAGLSAFRALIGAILTFSVLRFWAKGWIESIYIHPTFHFSYPGFGCATTPTEPVVYAVFAAMFAASVMLTVGLYPRFCAGVFFLTFTYAELWERATYLNHYYFVSLLALLLAFVPTAGFFSIRPDARQRVVAKLNYDVLRAFVSIVYFYAGFAKLNADWLFRGEPLHTWLKSYDSIFTFGGMVPLEWTAIAMSWGGALFDLTIWIFLLWEPTRKVAFLVAVGFHTTVGLLFPIGVFPVVMVAAITIFFAPHWPRLIRKLPVADTTKVTTVSPFATTAAAAFLLVQFVLPLRSFAYPGDVNWTDDGFKWSWRVMLVERVGALEYEVRTDQAIHRVNPRHALTEQQHHLLTVTPDMIVEYAHHLGERYREEGNVEVYAISSLAYNGRRSQAWVDPNRNLLKVSRTQFHDFILPMKD